MCCTAVAPSTPAPRSNAGAVGRDAKPLPVTRNTFGPTSTSASRPLSGGAGGGPRHTRRTHTSRRPRGKSSLSDEAYHGCHQHHSRRHHCLPPPPCRHRRQVPQGSELVVERGPSAELLIGEGVVASLPLESRKAWL